MDINQTISLGIGTPAGIPDFLTLGLQIGEEVAEQYEEGEISGVGNAGTVYSMSATGSITT